MKRDVVVAGVDETGVMRFGAICLLLAGCHLELYEDHEGTGVVVTQPRPDAPPSLPGPILHYPFDGSLENIGSLGPAFNATGMAISFVPGMRGNAVAFDQSLDTHVLLPSQVPMSRHDAYTVGFWFREDIVLNAGVTNYLFNNRGAGGFQTYHGASSQALTTCSDAGCQSIGYSVGPWHYITYVYGGISGTGAPLEIYVDAKIATQLPSSTVYFSDTQTNIMLGTRTNFQIDDFRAYARALNVEEICELMMGGVFDTGGPTRPSICNV